ncbi:MAG: 4Fe-4S binding protein [Dactylosporangium sp.]|nr:4Fe-4S binding protein [Dactylosporangium sp.]NNJ62378.1 4Fe-4S binding protein [Dactylosporangium sp.]
MTTTDERPPAATVPRRSSTTARRIRLARYSVQAAVIGIIGWQIFQAFTADGSGPEGLCPFGGFETMWTWITTGRTVRHVHPANLALAAAVLAMAVAGRGFFCGWICPFGAIQGAIHKTTSMVVDRIPPLRRWRRRAHRVTARPGGLARRLDGIFRYGRWLVLVWALGGAAMTGVMVFRDVDPWAALISVAEFEFSLAFTVLLVVLVLSLFVRRPFCRYACPLGAVQGLVAKISPVAIQRDAASCLGCDLCNQACPMNIPVNQRTRVTDSTCLGCLECVLACPSDQALGVSVGLPLPALRVPANDRD